MYVTRAGGRSRRYLGGALPPEHLYSLHRAHDGRLFAATYGELFVSDNRGENWRSLGGGGAIKDIYATGSGTLLAVHWRKGLLWWADASEEGFRKARGEEGDHLVTTLVESPSGRLWAGLLGGGVLVSDDGGRSWRDISEGLANPFVLALVWDRASKSLYAGTLESGVFRYRRGRWQSCSEGLPQDTSVQALARGDDATIWAGTHREGCFLLAAEAERWAPAGDRSLSVTALEPLEGRMAVGTKESGLLLAGADGRGWSALPYLSDPVTGLARSPGGEVWALARSGKLFRSTDGGRSWDVRGDIPCEAPCGALLAPDEGRLLAGGRGGIHRSPDGGAQWEEQRFPPGKEGESARQVMAMAETDRALWAATAVTLFRSTDSGRSWEPLEGIEGEYLRSLAARGTVVALGTDWGISVSTDDGDSWESQYVTYGITSVAFDGGGGLWAVSRNGFWRYSFEDTLVHPANKTIRGYSWSPFHYLYQIFPGEGEDLLALTSRGELVRLGASTEDGTLQWEAGNLSNTEVRSFLPLRSDGMLLGTDRGFFRSGDGGTTWAEIELP